MNSKLMSQLSVLPLTTAWFNHLAAENQSNEDALRRRLQTDDSERDGSDSSCSESVGGSTGGVGFRPTSSGSPTSSSLRSPPTNPYQSSHLSAGPPIHPPPHLLPYLYPHGLYPPPSHMSMLHNQAAAAAAAMNHPGFNPGLLFNAQLALAAQHPALFGHYSGHSPASPLNALKNHRFSPYSLPSGLGSAFDAVTPGSNSGGPRSLSSSPRPRAASSSPPTAQRPLSVSPPAPAPMTGGMQSPPAALAHPTALLPTVALMPPAVPPPAGHHLSPQHAAQQQQQHQQQPPIVKPIASSSPSELKSIEKMVNGLDVHTRRPPTAVAAPTVTARSTRKRRPSDTRQWPPPEPTRMWTSEQSARRCGWPSTMMAVMRTMATALAAAAMTTTMTGVMTEMTATKTTTMTIPLR